VTDLLLARLGWGPGVVDAVVCGDEVAAGRPAPDLILAAMRCCDVAAVARVAAVGDTVRDLEAGARAGVRWNVGVTSGAHDRATLSRAPHTHLLASVAELPALWEGSAGASPLSPAAGDLRIVPFRDELAPDFERLNRQWLVANGLLEEGDLPYLQRPREKIVDAGGAVFFALLDGAVVGTVAALPLGERTWELAKLAVDGGARGRGIGRRLTTTAIDFAAAAGARRIVLSSSSRLRAAVRLYESMGFRHSRVGAGVPYATADVFMELALGAAGDSPPSAVSAAP
jgi:ribosomal protein S18 acetylase RimI-like enzyme